MAVQNISALTNDLATQMRRNAVLQIATQTENMVTAGTVDLLTQSLQSMAVKKPHPGSIAQILNMVA